MRPMFTHKDIEYRTIFVVNCLNKKNLRVSNGELLLEEEKDGNMVTLTKVPFQKILALFIIGQITVTTPLIEKCKKFNVSLVVMKANLRPVLFCGDAAEANYLLRKRQYEFREDDLTVAKAIMKNKIHNQRTLLEKTRMKDELTSVAIMACSNALLSLDKVEEYNSLLGLEGYVSRQFFAAYFQKHGWKNRMPRAKCDMINATLDIGYSILFNYIEVFARMFGFDLYAGVYHRQWFKRKSLICDLEEPFRCIIDHTIRNALNRKQISEDDFDIIQNEYKLKNNKSGDYYRLFIDELVQYKTDVFNFMQSYYRNFMRHSKTEDYPIFEI